ncbi:hypothetical protein Poli38472_014699 [Pythium oligandrum]|uniref:Amino acid transporter n=1 Tax=Pythium oligandrum TaxID=41045 RepID=A0A8K1CJ47_PYTOL|nr:hypothetical protein Poli38472_014699 [Pythium oligandrum]|eukprot:TMW63994.1 hypothetical protein Poli38472_014699 [Pythium oligandrum]
MDHQQESQTRGSIDRSIHGGIVLLDPQHQENLSRRQPRNIHSFISANEESTTSSVVSAPNSNPRPTMEPSPYGRVTMGSPRTNFKSSNQTDAPPIAEHLHALEDSPIESVDAIEGDARAIHAVTTMQISFTWIMVGIIAGIILGSVLYFLKVSPLLAQWISLPGELFLRALKCLVIPYIFFAVAVAIGDIVYVGKVSIVGAQTIRVFLITWIATAAMGMGVAMLFKSFFNVQEAPPVSKHPIAFTCKNGETFELLSNGSVACSGSAGNLSVDALFEPVDVNSFFKKASTASSLTTLSDIIRASLESFVSANIAGSFTSSYIPGIVTFAMLLGTIAGHNFFNKTRRVNYLYLVMLQMRNAFFLALEWVIWLTPVAVVFIVAGSFAKNQESLAQFSRTYMFVIAIFVAAVLQVIVVKPLIVLILTRCNPYKHMVPMIRAYLFAFGCSSSLNTAPVTLSCIRKAKVCSPSIANFVISLGVCANSSASAFYYPITVVFLAESSDMGSELTPLRLVGLFVLGMLGCVATPGIPNGALIALEPIYKIVLGVSTMPSTYAFVIAIDMFVDRIRTVCNVNDDIMALKVIAENTDETVSAEYLGQRF